VHLIRYLAERFISSCIALPPPCPQKFHTMLPTSNRIFNLFPFILALAALILPVICTDTSLFSQCLPKSVLLFANLACSRSGFTYVMDKPTKSVGSKPPNSQPYGQPNVNFAPWSFEPACTRMLPSIESRLCVYTSVEFNQGRGISLFTTPETAELLASLPPFRDRAVSNDTAGAGNLQYTRRLEKTGRGTKAKYRLERGDRIAVNVPIIVVYGEYEISWQEREEFLRIATMQLPVATQRLLRNLVADSGGPRLMLCGIMDTNAGFMFEIGDHEHYGLFPEFSLLNHHCAPKYVILIPFEVHALRFSSQFRIDPSALTLSLYASRSILHNDDITISCTLFLVFSSIPIIPSAFQTC